MNITRLAPSPTGALHLGNARTFLVNWLLARQNGWRIILRIEDIDGPRIRRRADQEAIDDLRWLGIDWDDGPIYQSSRLDRYAAAIGQLGKAGLTYRCTCTRRDVESAASAPHVSDGAAIYPGTCRMRQIDPATPAALRVRMSDETRFFDDDFAGRRRFDLQRELGDFVIRKTDGTPSYQLTVVVDDADMNITHVVRGDDLIDSTPRQIFLYESLGLADRIPRFTHLPLVIGRDGLRLAKRHGDTRLSRYRKCHDSPAAVLRLLARWSGIEPPGALQTARDLLGRFDLARMPRTPIVLTGDDERTL